MKTPTLNEEFAAITVRTRRLIGGSTILHLLLLLLLLYYRTSTAAPEGITEITWIEAAPPAPAVEETAPPVAKEEAKAAPVQTVRRAPTREEPVKQFRRELKRAEVEPRPQTSKSMEDVLSKRVETLESKSSASRTRMAALVTPPKVGSPSPVGLPKTTPAPRAQSDLRRTASRPSAAPAELRRSPDAPRRPTTLATPQTAPPTARGKVDPAATTSSTRNVAGAQLAGPVADRALLSHETPVYPEWAKQDGVEASVTLRFFVMSNGLVKENVLVEKTSGFRDFDNSSVAALLQWRFKALPGSAEQWGRITFHFRLSDMQ